MRRRLLLVATVLAVALVGGGCLQYVTPEGPAPLRYRDEVFAGVTTTTDVVYGSAVDQQGATVTLLTDVYEPAGDVVAARPAVVWVHGGSFCCGNKTSPEIVDEATTLAREGYVGFSIDYRLAPHGCSAAGPTTECLLAIRDATWDAQTAVRFVREHAGDYGVDPTRIAIAGTSAGAITALDVGYSPESPGPGDHAGESSAVRAAVSLSGARILGTPNAGDAPALLFHGTADVVVPYQWAVDTVTAAQDAGLLALLTPFDGEGHVPYHRDTILTQTTNFLYHTLDLSHAAGA